MNPLKALASQTAIYGISSIFGRFLNYLLVPLFTYYFTPAEYGTIAEFYAYAGFFSVLLIFGLETGYFRYRDQENKNPDIVYSTILRFLLIANLGFFLLIVAIHQLIADTLRYSDHPEYVIWIAAILAMDAIGAAAFAKLRAENRAFRFAGIKIIEILINVSLCLFLIVYCQKIYATAPHSLIGQLWDPAVGIGYIFIANLIASAIKLLILAPQLRGIVIGFDAALFKTILGYSLPMMIIGFAGVINEMLDRAILKYLLPYDTQTNLALLGIYSACYKLSILMSLFIQAFRYAAEPFFFAYARNSDAKNIYVAVLNYFVIFCVFIFLVVTLFLDFFQYFIGEPFRAGLHVVPILLMANLCLGIYTNLSIWYKLTDRTMMGAYLAIGGAILTIILNFLLIPIMGYEGSAWATLGCYGFMAVASYFLGRVYYPVPYDIKRIISYICLGLIFYFFHKELGHYTQLPAWVTGTLLLLAYLIIAFIFDGRKARLLRRTS